MKYLEHIGQMASIYKLYKRVSRVSSCFLVSVLIFQGKAIVGQAMMATLARRFVANCSVSAKILAVDIVLKNNKFRRNSGRCNTLVDSVVGSSSDTTDNMS